jgi:hypothetical protein
MNTNKMLFFKERSIQEACSVLISKKEGRAVLEILGEAPLKEPYISNRRIVLIGIMTGGS